jgi:hypothetical protein
MKRWKEILDAFIGVSALGCAVLLLALTVQLI